MADPLLLTSALSACPHPGHAVQLNGKWYRTHLHEDCVTKRVPMPKGWVASVREKAGCALERDLQAPLQAGENRIVCGDPPLMLYKWVGAQEGFLGLRDLTKPFRMEVSPKGVFGLTASALYQAPLDRELGSLLQRSLGAARQDFTFNRLNTGSLPKPEFVRRLKEGKLQKVGNLWLPTHKLFPGQPRLMTTEQREKLLPLLEQWAEQERQAPLRNGESRELADGTLAYKWLGDSSPRTGMVGFKPSGANYRIELDGENVWVLSGKTLYETPATKEIKNHFRASLQRTRNPYKQGKTGHNVATGSAETQMLADYPGVRYIAGLDESGRSNLAGPLVASAVLIDSHQISPVFARAQDSKGMAVDERYLLSEALKKSLPYGIGEVWPDELNGMNLNKANKLAFERALEDLQKRLGKGQSVDAVLVDGSGIVPEGRNVRSVARGEQSSLSIAAASVLAAEHFHQCLEEMDKKCAGYGFARTKAQSTDKFHYAALVAQGPSPYHRLQFKPVQRALAEHRMQDLSR